METERGENQLPMNLVLNRSRSSARRNGALPLVVVGLLLSCASPAFAQQTMSDVLSFLLTNRSIPTDDFVQDEQVAAAVRDTITGSLAIGLATLPVSSSASGFTYRLDQSLGGVPTRASQSFGPFFTDRTLTLGPSRGSLGASYQRSTFTAIDGRDLRDGTLVATASSFGTEPQPFDVETVTLRMHTDTLTLSGNYGAGDRVDIGAAIPFVRLSLEGERIDTYRGRRLTQASASATASGVGDLLVRVKYNALRAAGTGIAFGVDARLPTGDEENLLGTGEAAVKPKIIWSAEADRIAVDGDLGFSFGGLTDEITYGGAVTVIGSPRLMLVGEIAGRRLQSAGKLTEITEPHPRLAGISTIRLSAVEASSHRAVAVVGVKWNPTSTWLVGANVVRRLTTAGVTADWVPSVGIEYSFGQ